jgi:deazaflavin-dependent oxidoreductase (nitroreductase family)
MTTSTIKSPASGLHPLSRKERIARFLEHTLDRRLGRFGVALYRLTSGRIAQLYGKDVLLLTTRGRRSGQERTVLLQFFRDGAQIVVVAANSGLSSHPGWFYNLKATPAAQIQVMDRLLQVRAEELAADEVAAFWPRILQRSPDYARYRTRTSRTIPLVRLIPVEPSEGALP